jgi:hypothetical protein
LANCSVSTQTNINARPAFHINNIYYSICENGTPDLFVDEDNYFIWSVDGGEWIDENTINKTISTSSSSSTTNKNLKKIQTFLLNSTKENKFFMTSKSFSNKTSFQSPSKDFERKYNFLKNEINSIGSRQLNSKYEINVDLNEKQNLKITKKERLNMEEAVIDKSSKGKDRLVRIVDFKKRGFFEDVQKENKEIGKINYNKK